VSKPTAKPAPPAAHLDLPPNLEPLSAGLGHKLLPVDALAETLNRRRAAGETVVFTNGCFDVLHIGHVCLLDACRQFGDVVVVGVNSDASVRLQNKAPDRPICDEHSRVLMLAALETVDYVVRFEEETPVVLLERLRPDVLVKGAHYGVPGGVVGRELVESYGGRIELAPIIESQSTTMLINLIRSRAPEVR